MQRVDGFRRLGDSTWPRPGNGDRYAMPVFWGPGEAYLMRRARDGGLCVCKHISRFPMHVVPIMTSTVIECHRSGLRASFAQLPAELGVLRF